MTLKPPFPTQAEAVEAFANALVERGYPIEGDTMVEMLTWCCKQRKCTRTTLNAPPAVKPRGLPSGASGAQTAEAAHEAAAAAP